MRKNKVALFLNGEPVENLPDLSQFNKIYCTDGAYKFLRTKNIKPDVISGDFDSWNPNEVPENVELIKTPNQDFTDFEKVLQIIIERKLQEVSVYNASGKEQDHFLGNLSVAYKYKDKVSIKFFDNYGFYFFANKTTELNGYKGRVISLYPFPYSNSIKTKGLRYPLNNEKLSITDRIGIRNFATDDLVSIEFEGGGLLIFVNNRN